MIAFFKKYINIIISLSLLVYYILVSWGVHRTGFEHSEAMFIAEKIKLLFEAPENTLLTLGTTFPSLIFLFSVVFAPFGYPYAPVLASITCSTLLYFFLIKDFSKSALPAKVFIPMIVLLFMFHPGLLYTAISGRGIAGILLFFYLLFRSLFQYYQSQTSFYLSMASIYLSCLVFCDYNFIWLLLAFFPFIFLVSLDGLKLSKKGQPAVVQYFEALNIRSQRRKLANRTIAIYIVVFLLPLGALLLFKTLNFYHAGDASYFLTSQYANWHVTGRESLGSLALNSANININGQTHIVFQVYILLLTPLLILVFFLFKGPLHELFTLLAPFILVSIILLDNQYYITIEYYLIFLILALIGLCFYIGKKYKTKLIYPIVMAVTILNIYTGIFYFKHSDDKEEVAFFNSLKKVARTWNDQRVNSEEYQLAAYISDISDVNHTILMDDAAAYQIMAHIRSLKSVIMPVNNDFITIIENPKLKAKYICVAKLTNRLSSFTVLNDYNIHQLELKKAFDPTIMFETEHWAIYKIF